MYIKVSDASLNLNALSITGFSRLPSMALLISLHIRRTTHRHLLQQEKAVATDTAKIAAERRPFDSVT
jgi:hypothetical protein